MICLIDNTEHDSFESLHKYLRFKLKITQKDYYTEYIAKKDLLTGEPIEFKDANQYLNADFINKYNLRLWMIKNPKIGKEWAIKWLNNRKLEKELVYSPCQVELRSLDCPTMHYFEKVGGYYNICESLGYKNLFNQETLKFSTLPKDASIITDTREQLPLKLSITTKIEKVDEGDYALCEKYDKGIYIERKSLMDMLGTLTKDLGRFERELDRSKEKGSYIVMLVEQKLDDVLNIDELKKIGYISQLKYTKVSAGHVLKNIRDVLHKYSNFQILFVNGRKQAAKAVVKIFELGTQVKNIDLQYKLETGELNLE